MLMEESKNEKSTMEVGIVSEETVQNKIYTVRGYKVMLDVDLAEMMDSFVDKEDNGWLTNIGAFEKCTCRCGHNAF